MRVDLDAEQADLEELPRFQRAAFHARRMLRLGVVLGILAVIGLVGAFFVGLFEPDSPWSALLSNNAAALLVLVAGVQSAYWVARWRDSAIEATPTLTITMTTAEVEGPSSEGIGWYERMLQRISQRGRDLIVKVGLPTLCLGGLALVVLLSVEQVWNLSLRADNLGRAGYIGAGLFLILAFGLLVLERQWAQENPAQWPEAEKLAALARVAIICLVLSVVALLFSSPDAIWPARLAVLIGLLPAVVAVELLIRAFLSLFSPHRERLEPRLVGESFIAEMLRWPPQPVLALQHELHNRFGIDLRQIWAFTYMRRAFAPVLWVVLVIGWALTGVHQVPLQGRGIYERFGKPVEVFGPGLHIGLPWPLGRVIAVENGIVHELATSVEAAANPVPGPAEGPAPMIANRLWDASHVNDSSQVIASGSNDKQGFQIVNMDMRFVYRIGLSDQAALAATYNNADVPALIRSTASRILVNEFASQTLDGLLGEQRSTLADEIGRALQADLQKLGSGVEILATVVEAIHPPAGAANAYHAVQAAQISAQALISRQQGAAAEQTNQAQLQASVIQDKALATAREVRSAAQAADLRFNAEQKGYAQAGQAFVLEHYFSQLSLGLSNAKLLVLDHRLGGSSAPTIDLRTFTLPTDPSPSRKVAQ